MLTLTEEVASSILIVTVRYNGTIHIIKDRDFNPKDRVSLGEAIDRICRASFKAVVNKVMSDD
jgi:hypothetical protein